MLPISLITSGPQRIVWVVVRIGMLIDVGVPVVDCVPISVIRHIGPGDLRASSWPVLKGVIKQLKEAPVRLYFIEGRDCSAILLAGDLCDLVIGDRGV